jgi:alpha-1,2-mannosyltransferase
VDTGNELENSPADGAIEENDALSAEAGRRCRRLLLIAGMVAFGLAVGIYLTRAFTHPMSEWMDPVDLRVYRFGGLIAAHVRPWYEPHRGSPLYGWPGYEQLKFTYTPFASMVFIVATLLPLVTVERLSLAVNTVMMLAAIWVTFNAAGWPTLGRTASRPANRTASRTVGRAELASRVGVTLLTGGLMFWSEPVQRTLYLGQIELILMALIMWDLGQPDRRLFKGAGVGVAAGIKLVPLIFIPYLLLTRRFRQAFVAAGTFALTVVIGFAVDPADSARWWIGGVFAQGSRTGFIGWEGNQSLRALITRFAGSVAAGQDPWLLAAAVTVVVGLTAAVLLDRAGHRVVAVLTCALTGLLGSPISWDHHWVWVVPGVAVAISYAARLRGRMRWACAAVGGAIALGYFAWPGRLWGEPADLGGFSLGLIWAPPNTNPGTYDQFGDRPWYVEYHWHGLELLTGNLYVLVGIALFIGLVALSLRLARHRPATLSQITARTLASSSNGAQKVSMK